MAEMSMALKVFTGSDTTTKTYKEYREWKVCVMAAVGMKNKGGGAEGINVFAKEADKEKSTLDPDANSLVYYMLIAATTGAARQLVLEAKPGDGRDAVIALDSVYLPNSDEDLETNLEEFQTLVFRNGIQLRQDVTRLHREIDLAVKYPISFYRRRILSLLPERFELFVSTQREIPKLKEDVSILLAAIIQAERNIMATSVKREESANLIEVSKHDFKKKYCTHCNKAGHTEDLCYTLHGHPDKANICKTCGYHKPTSTNSISNSSASTQTSLIAQVEEEFVSFGF